MLALDTLMLVAVSIDVTALLLLIISTRLTCTSKIDIPN